MTFTPTPEQIAIVEAARDTEDNLLVGAYAGAAKTKTLELVAHAKVEPTLALAFNKRIADELGKRLPGHVMCKTLNSIGHGAWTQTIGKRPNLEIDKSRLIFKALAEEASKADKQEMWDRVSEIMGVFREARQQGYVPPKYQNRGRTLIEQEEFYAGLEEEPDALLVDTVERMLQISIDKAYYGEIDFDDQIYMSTLFGGVFPRFPRVLGDEVQDWTPLNHAMVDKLVVKRLIAVGDELQSIYGFRGAMQNGMKLMKERYNMRELHLSISFRCPRSVIRNARWRATNMQWPEWAEEGICQTLTALKAEDVPDGAVFICRNNAPLFSTALEFLKAGRGIKILGNDIGPGLIKILKNLGELPLSQDQALLELDRWYEAKKKKSRALAALADRYECLKFFIEQGPTLGAAIAWAEHIFSASGPIQFSSGHKSKGLEWDTVYHLNPSLVGKFAFSPSAIEQEHNLKYVIETRAKKALYIIEGENIEFPSRTHRHAD